MCKKNKRYGKNFLSKAQKDKIIDYTFAISSIIGCILGFSLGIFLLPYYNSLALKFFTVTILTLGGFMFGLAIAYVILLLFQCILKIVNFIQDCIY